MIIDITPDVTTAAIIDFLLIKYRSVSLRYRSIVGILLLVIAKLSQMALAF